MRGKNKCWFVFYCNMNQLERNMIDFSISSHLIRLSIMPNFYKKNPLSMIFLIFYITCQERDLIIIPFGASRMCSYHLINVIIKFGIKMYYYCCSRSSIGAGAEPLPTTELATMLIRLDKLKINLHKLCVMRCW